MIILSGTQHLMIFFSGVLLFLASTSVVCKAWLTTISPKASIIPLRYSAGLINSDSVDERIKWWETENKRLLDASDTYLDLKPKFQSLLPKPWTEAVDVSLEFTDAHEGAKLLAHKCGLDGSVEPFFQESMSYFQQLCYEMIPGMATTPKAKVRIVSTRGSSGTKCPRWHVDHVPVRWIQSLVGPGCDYVVDEIAINREALNSLDLVDELSSEELNKLIVTSSSQEAICQAPEGQAVILMGRSGNNKACVHKSPDLNLFQGRVLMTMDVVLPDSIDEKKI